MNAEWKIIRNEMIKMKSGTIQSLVIGIRFYSLISSELDRIYVSLA